MNQTRLLPAFAMAACQGIGLALLAAPALQAQPVSPYYRLEQQAGLLSPPQTEPAVNAQLVSPAGVAVDRNGDLYVADHYSLRRVGRDGRSTVVAGTSAFQCLGEVGHLYQYGPVAGGTGGCWARNLALSAGGEILIAHSGYYQVWAFDGRANRAVAGVNSGNTWGGTGGDGGQATRAFLNSPSGVAADAQGNIYIADSGNHVIRKISPNGIITRFAGTGAAGGTTTDGMQALATALNYPMAVAAGSAGFVYIANTFADTVLRVSPGGQVQRIAGGGAASANDGDDGPATGAVLRRPVSLAVNAAGDIFIAEGNRIRRIRNGIISTFAGARIAGDTGDGGPANRALLNYPNGVHADASGLVYIADTGNNLVRRVDPSGVITTVAGTREVPDGKLLSDILLRSIGGMAVHSDGTLYFSNADNSRIQRLSRDGRVFVHAGSGFGFAGDSGPAARARFNTPLGLAFDSRGNLFVADSLNHRVRRIDPAGVVTTVAGTGEAGFSGDGGQASRAQLSRPTSVSVDKSGAIYISDADNFRIRKVAPDGVITTIAGNGQRGTSGDWGKATDARLYSPTKVVVSDSGAVYVADAGDSRVRRIRPDGIITPFAGGAGAYGINGWGEYDSINAQSAGLHGMKGLAVDAAGNVFLAAGFVYGNVFVVDPNGGIVDIAGQYRQGEAFLEWDRRTFDDGLVVARGYSLPILSEIAVDRASGSVFVFSPTLSRLFTLKPLGPAKLELIGPTQVSCVAGDSIPVKARLSLGDGRPLARQRVRFTTSDGLFQHPSTETTGSDGVAVAQGRAVLCRSADIYVRVLGIDTHRVRLYPMLPPAAPSTGAQGIPIPGPADTAKHLEKAVRYSISTVNSKPALGDDGDAKLATLAAPRGLAIGPGGDLYIADSLHHRVRKVSRDGVISTVAGTGVPGFSGDGGPASSAMLNTPYSVAVAADGTLYIADRWNYRVRKVVPDGTISTVAGVGEPGEDADKDKPAASARIGPPLWLALSEDGSLYFTSTGTWTRWSHTWTVDGAGILRLHRQYEGPIIAAGPRNTVYIADTRGGQLAGTVRKTTAGYYDLEAQFSDVAPYLSSFAVGKDGRVYACEHNRVRVGSAGSGPATIAGSAHKSGFAGDGGPAAEALLSDPEGIAIHADGRIFISDTGNHRIRVILPDGRIETVAGGGHDAEGHSAVTIPLLNPSGLSADSSGGLWVSDSGHGALRRLAPDGSITSILNPMLSGVAGIRWTEKGILAAIPGLKGLYSVPFQGEPKRLAGEEHVSGEAAEGGWALYATNMDPSDAAMDGSGSLFIVDRSRRKVRRVTPEGHIFTYASQLSLVDPVSLAIDSRGSVIVADRGGHTVYAIDANGDVRTVLGVGMAGWGEDGGLGWQVETYQPQAVGVDSFGNIYVGGGGRVRKILADGRVFTIAGGGTKIVASESEGGDALEAALGDIAAITVDSSGFVYVAERAENRIRRLIPNPDSPSEP